MNYNFFAFISRMRYINRWGLMRNTVSENIQEHSFEVSIIAHALCIIANKYYDKNLNPEKAAVFALYHDCNEIITGDMPTPVKYFNQDIVNAYKNLEDISKHKILSMLPKDIQEEYKEILMYEDVQSEYKDIVKAADKISAYIKCVEEEKAGNTEFKQAAKATLKKINGIDLPEVKYFMKHFIGGYKLTLDEIQD